MATTTTIRGAELRIVDDVPGTFAELVRDAGPRVLALSGGETARRCYEALAGAAGIDWAGVEVIMGDERFVPVDHEDSNEGMARAALLERVQVARVHSATGAARDRDGASAEDTVEAAAGAYDEVVRGLVPIDVNHLGLGDDGHTASLFPGSPALEVVDRLVVATGDEAHPHPRVTLTYEGIRRSRLTVVTVEGEGKAAVLARIAAGEDLPAGRIEAERVVWLVDPAAASQLP